MRVKNEPKINAIAKEFKEFALRGNMVDLAVGVVLGIWFWQAIGGIITL